MQSLRCRVLSRGVISTILFITFVLCPFLGGSFANQTIKDDLFDVSFPTEKDGWACGRWGAVVHTADGGKTWSRQDTGTDYTLASISFVDENNGWAVGDHGTIIHTKDGGMTWEKQTPPLVTIEGTAGWGGRGGSTKVENKVLEFFLMGVHFATPDKGWIVTERTHVLYTDDGGQTWEVQFSDEDFILQDVSFCDEMNGWAVGEYGYVYHTDDGGGTWEHQAGMFDFSEETGDIIGGNFLFGVAAVDPNTAWAVGIDGYVTMTKDGGATWEQVDRNFPKTHLYGVTADRHGTVVIGGSAALLVSADNGKNFKVVSADPPITYGWLFGFGTRGEDGYVAVGKNQWVYLSGKDLNTWRMAGKE
jgi:photosystem II stability/assembly factor-like uncharacterized protein